MTSASAFDELRRAAAEVMAFFVQARLLDQGQRRSPEADRARELGGRLLHQRFSRWFERHYQRLGLDEAQAQDLTQEAFIKLYLQANGGTVPSNPFALICAIRRSTFLDHFRHQRADKRLAASGESAEVLLGDDEWLDLIANSGASEEASADLADCVQRKLAQMQSKSASRAEILELLCFGMSAREIAAVVYAKPESDVSAQEAANIRDRIYNTRNQARALFAECREGA